MIKLSADNVSKEDIDALCDWLKTYPRLTQGDLVKQFETKFSEYLEVKHSVFVNSGSSANLMALYATKLLRGDVNTVAVSALSWATTVAPIYQLEMKPVFIDCCYENLGPDLDDLEEKFKEYRPQVFICVSVLGFTPYMSQILSLCNRYNVTLIEDNCESLGTEYSNCKLGNFGSIATYSCYASHHITTLAEGGFCVTNDSVTHELLLQLRAHGWIRDLSKEKQDKKCAQYSISEFDRLYKFFVPGFNMRNTEPAAFVGLRQLERLPEIVNTRHCNYMRFYDNLADIFKGLIPTPYNGSTLSVFAFPVIHSNRNAMIAKLADNGIETRPLISGSMTRQPMCQNFGEVQECQVAENIEKYGFYLPNHHNLKFNEIDLMCEIIRGECW